MYKVDIKQERLKEKDLTCQKVKSELSESIQKESSHRNEDNAKKRAVAQGSSKSDYYRNGLR